MGEVTIKIRCLLKRYAICIDKKRKEKRKHRLGTKIREEIL